MPLIVRDFGTMTEAVLDRIIAADVGITSKAQGSVIRTIVESLIAEIDIEYYQLQYVYDGIDIDLAEGDDLDRLIAILGVIRNQATKASGSVTFSRSTPALVEIPIPYGSVVGSRQDQNGVIIEVVITDTDLIMSVGEMSIVANVETSIAGATYLAIGKLCVMSKPIIGIESVWNYDVISGGSDIETDKSLRSRAKLALSGLGKATRSALEGAIRSIPGVTDVYIIDMARGIATTDISIVCSTMPPTPELSVAIDKVVSDTKASGIDVQVTYPIVVTANISVTLTKTIGYDVNILYDLAGDAITRYFSTLGIGDSLIITQLERSILNSSEYILDIQPVEPTANVIVTNMQVLRVGTITIDGVVW